MTDNERQNRAMKKLINKWVSEGNFANGYISKTAKEYGVLVRPLRKRFNDYLNNGYDISVVSIGGNKL